MSNLNHHTFATPLGDMLVVADDSSVYYLAFVDGYDLLPIAGRTYGLPTGESRPGMTSAIELMYAELMQYFSGDLRQFTVQLALQGTLFQQRVWAQLQGLLYGATCTYGGLATAMQHPRACRAVGTAVGANPVAIIVPCHRVKGACTIGGYRGRIERKKWLLEHEANNYAFTKVHG